MIKHKQIDRVASVTLDEGFDTGALAIVSPESKKLFNDLNDYKESIARDESHVERYTRDIEDLTRLKTNTLNSLASKQIIYSEATKALEALDLTSYQAKVDKLKKSLLNIPDIRKVIIRGNDVVVETLPLFTKVRVGDGERKTVRRCIGAFGVTFDLSRDYMIAENITFRNCNRNHWSISGDSCCMGNWEPQYRELVKNADIIGLVKMSLMYLTSTKDGGAYMRAHNWIDDRDARYNKEAGTFRPELKVDDTVIYRTYYRMAIVTEVHPNGTHVRLQGFKSDNGYADSDWIDKTRLYKLSKIKYRTMPSNGIEWEALISDAKSKVKIPVLIRATDKIDALKDGVSNDEVLELIKQYGR